MKTTPDWADNIRLSSASCIAGFVGQTAEKTRNKLREARGGILFVDEAYNLVQNENDSFGQEALTELLTFMENNRQSMSIIVAGYPNEMEQFLGSNPGFASRFSRTIEFKNFTQLELLQITLRMAEERGYTLTKSLQDGLLELFEMWILDATQSFGNAREVRKLLDAMIDEAGSRLATGSWRTTTQ